MKLRPVTPVRRGLGRARGMAFAAVFVASLAGAAAANGAAGGPLAEWSRLMPAGWVPEAILEPFHLEDLSDGDPEAVEALAKVRAVWDRAPVNPLVLDRPIRLFGYMVPVDADEREIREFLLVPYFGGCIHEPSPPANQMARVIPAIPLSARDRGTSAFWITGRLVEERTPSSMGIVAYRIVAATIEPYRLESITPRAIPD
ncbi:MAG: DUF3299 domain-containing protein [Burkholderiaceae bacterium]